MRSYVCELSLFFLQESDTRASEHTVSENLEAPARENDTPAKDICGQMTIHQVCWQESDYKLYNNDFKRHKLESFPFILIDF